MAGVLSSTIIEDLDKKIRDGLLTEGMKLPSERVMAKTYGVSRNVVREAYKVMSEKKLVDIIVGKGAYVKVPKAKDISEKLKDAISVTKSNLYDILEVREVLEVAIAKKSIQCATDEDIKTIENIYKQMTKYHNDPLRYWEEDKKFHIAIAKSTGNELYVLLITTLYYYSDKDLKLLSDFYPDRTEKAEMEHRAMIQALKDRDEKYMLLAVKEHLSCIESEVNILQNKKNTKNG